MNHSLTLELLRTELGTLLPGIAADLRLAALSLEAAARETGEPGEPAHEALTALAARLDRHAAVLAACARTLCPACKMTEAVERFSVGNSARGDRIARYPRIATKPLKAAEPSLTSASLN